MIAFVDDLDVWLKLRKKIVQLSKAREKVHASTTANQTTSTKEQELMKEIAEETLRKEQQVKDDLLFLQKSYISEQSEYQINISAKLRSELNAAISGVR